jgi:hypothetical protein
MSEIAPCACPRAARPIAALNSIARRLQILLALRVLPARRGGVCLPSTTESRTDGDGGVLDMARLAELEDPRRTQIRKAWSGKGLLKIGRNGLKYCIRIAPVN